LEWSSASIILSTSKSVISRPPSLKNRGLARSQFSPQPSQLGSAVTSIVIWTISLSLGSVQVPSFIAISASIQPLFQNAPLQNSQFQKHKIKSPSSTQSPNMDTNKDQEFIDQAAVNQALIDQAITNEALKVQNIIEQLQYRQALKVQHIIEQLQYRQALLDEPLEQQLDAPSFTENVPPTENPATNSTPATSNTTPRLKWLLRFLLLFPLLIISLLYPNIYPYIWLYLPIHKQYILNCLDLFLAIALLPLVEGLLATMIAQAVSQLEAGYGECRWEGTWVETVLRELWRVWEAVEGGL
jgi:hypothetical protein